MARKEIPRELSIYINDKQVVNSLAGITREISRTNNEMRNLNKNSETYDKDLARLKGDLSALTEKQSEFKNEIKGTSEALDDGAGSFKKFRDGLLSGDLQSAKEGLSGIKGEFLNLTKSAWAFVATPVGAAIAVLAGFVAGTKYLFDFNKELEVSNKTLRAFGVAAEELSKVRSEIQATAETFNKEFDEIAEKANSLSKTYQISISEANKIIAQGLAEGGAQNKEFLDSIGEYDEFFSKAGYSAQEFINVINKGFDLGIYSDKLPDALKEADLSLKEQTKATRDALENAFGAAFSDELLAKVASGTITTKQALEEIAVQAKKTGLTQQQQAQLTADVFKGAGEDAGGALKILEAVGQTAQKELSATAKAQLELLDANERLNKAQAELFEIEGFSGIWDGIKASATSALADIIDWIVDVKRDIQPLIDIVGGVFAGSWYVVKNVVGVVFSFIGSQIKLFSSAIGGVTRFVISSFQLIVEKTAPILSALGVDVDKLQKKLDSLKSKNVVVKTTTKPDGSNPDNPEVGNTKALAEELAKQKALRDAARQKEADARAKAAAKKKADEEKAAKEEYDRTLALAKAKADLAKAEIASFIANNRSKIEAGKALTPEIIADETKRLEDIRFLQENELANERLRKVEAAQADLDSGKINAETLAALKSQIDLEYLTAEQNLDLEFQKSTDALKKQYLEEQKVLAAEQLQADNELALAEAQTKDEEEALKRDQDYDKQIKGYSDLLKKKVITKEEYDRFEAAAAAKKKEMDRVAEIQKVQGTLGGLSQLAGAVTDLFGQSKEMAIVQAGINGALAVTSILAQYPKFDGGFAMWAAIAAAGITTIAQVAKITKAKPAKEPKFFYGGHTGNTAHLGYDEYGPMTGVVHKNEYVIPEAMTQNPRYANTIAWLEQERTGRVKKFADGGETSPGTLPSGIPDSISNQNEMLAFAIATLNNILANGITAKTIIGYEEAKGIEDLNNERAQSAANAIVNE